MTSIKLLKQLNSAGARLPGNLGPYLVSTQRSLLAWTLTVGSRYGSRLHANCVELSDWPFI